MVRKKRIHLSVYILVPVIFCGLSILSVIITFEILTNVSLYADVKEKYIGILILISAITTYVIAFFVLWYLLRPFEQFVEKTKNLNIQDNRQLQLNTSGKLDELYKYTDYFNKVANLLTTVQIKQLFPNIIGQSRSMRTMLTQLIKIAQTDSPVFILGESGTGKELVAASIYEHSERKGSPFIKINCAAIPDGLIESELFGHEKGSFTGAIKKKKGKFEIANGGTIFLDEIGDMPLSTQVKILRVLQEKEFEYVGGTETIKVDVRFIAATNRDIVQLMKDGLFREDLFYRLNVFSITVPPLRDRREDIPILACHFLSTSKNEKRLTSKALQVLIGYGWPGNVRELQNMLNRAVITSDNDEIDQKDLSIYSNVKGNEEWIFEKKIKYETMYQNSLDEMIREIEKDMIINALIETRGIQAKAATILGINQRSLWHRVKKYNIDVNRLKKK